MPEMCPAGRTVYGADTCDSSNGHLHFETYARRANAIIHVNVLRVGLVNLFLNIEIGNAPASDVAGNSQFRRALQVGFFSKSSIARNKKFLLKST
jgi:hypothetical protein